MDSLNNNNPSIQVITPGKKTTPRRRIARWLTFAVVIFVIGGAASFWLVKNNNEAAIAESVATVEITGSGFVPQTIRVKKGESIQWVNADTKPHQVVSDPYPSGDTLPDLNSSEPLTEGESYTRTFDQTGTFTYHDQLNPLEYKATIIVE